MSFHWEKGIHASRLEGLSFGFGAHCAESQIVHIILAAREIMKLYSEKTFLRVPLGD